MVADIDRDSSNLTAETIERVITPRTKAIVAVHLAGWPCDMDSILELARSRGIAVIEDCAQAHGARYRGRPIGSFGDMAAFSFCQDKNMTTGGEGGMLLTNDRRLWELGWSFKDHGKSFDAVYERSHPPGYRFLHESFGTNWRLTEAQSAIGRVLLRKLPGMVEKRRRNAAYLSREFARIPALRVVTPGEDVFHSYYKYDVYVRPERLREGWDRNRIQEAISAEGRSVYGGHMQRDLSGKGFSGIDAAASPAASGAGTWRDQSDVQGSSHADGARPCRHVHGGIEGHADCLARLRTLEVVRWNCLLLRREPGRSRYLQQRQPARWHSARF